MKHLDWIDRTLHRLMSSSSPARSVRSTGAALVLTAAAAITSTVAAPAIAADYPASKEGTWVVRDFRFHTGEVLPDGAAARQRVAEELTWDQTAARFEQAYARALGMEPGAGTASPA